MNQKTILYVTVFALFIPFGFIHSMILEKKLALTKQKLTGLKDNLAQLRSKLGELKKKLGQETEESVKKEREKAAAQKADAERIAAELAATKKAAAEKLAAEKANAEKAAKEKADTEKLAAEEEADPDKLSFPDRIKLLDKKLSADPVKETPDKIEPEKLLEHLRRPAGPRGRKLPTKFSEDITSELDKENKPEEKKPEIEDKSKIDKPEEKEDKKTEVIKPEEILANPPSSENPITHIEPEKPVEKGADAIIIRHVGTRNPITLKWSYLSENIPIEETAIIKPLTDKDAIPSEENFKRINLQKNKITRLEAQVPGRFVSWTKNLDDQVLKAYDEKKANQTLFIQLDAGYTFGTVTGSIEIVNPLNNNKKGDSYFVETKK